jgi:hypothetical protein
MVRASSPIQFRHPPSGVSLGQRSDYVRAPEFAAGLCGEFDLLNRFDPRSPAEAEVKYLDGDFRVLRPGAFVRCAVTAVPIPLEELKYWSVERQEAYATPEAVLRRLYPERAK